MKKIRLFMMAAIGLFAVASPQSSQAQNSWKWTGTTPAAAAAASGDEATVYLLNVGRFQNSTDQRNGIYWLGRGGKWGTEAIVSNTPMELTVTASGSGYLLHTTVNEQGKNTAGMLGLMLDNNKNTNGSLNDGNNTVDHLSYYDDRGEDDDAVRFRAFYFSQVEGSTNVFQLYNTGTVRNYLSSSTFTWQYYMVAGRNSSSTDENTFTTEAQSINGFTSDNLPTDKSDQWMLISKKELKDYFMQVDAAENDPALASFMVTDPDFARNDAAVSSWKTGTNNADLTMETRTSGSEITPANQRGTYYVGNGYQSNATPQATYGHQWAAYIHGSGSIHQNIDLTGLRPGWYAVRVNVVSSEDNAAKVYASAGGATQETTDRTPYKETAVAASEFSTDHYYNMEAACNAGTSTQHTVMVYVSNVSKGLTIGVDATGASNDTWTVIDNFTLFYHGDPEKVINVLLDEDQTSVDYINAQNKYVNDNKKDGSRLRSNIYLKRNLNQGKWNSIVLPFSISQDVIQTVFGQGTIVSELKGAINEAHPGRIYFEQVPNIVAGRLYLIKPTNSQPTPNIARQSSATENNNPVISFGENDSYWSFVPASFGQDTDFSADVSEEGKKETTKDGTVYFAGTYINHGEDLFIPVNSYVIAYNDTKSGNAKQGYWYYRTKGTKTKGFRGWLQTIDPTATAKVSFSINGVVDEDETTAIDGVTTDRQVETRTDGVYNLNGQLVRSGNSLEGLKGIYIVNGRKVVVK